MTGLNPCLKMISAPELKTFAEHVNEPLPAYGELPHGTDANMKGSMKAIQRDQLDRLQHALEPEDWKPMTGLGAGVREIRVRDQSGAWRAIYIAKLADAVYVLHCFQKKTQKTLKSDIDLARARLGELTAAKTRRVK